MQMSNVEFVGKSLLKYQSEEVKMKTMDRDDEVWIVPSVIINVVCEERYVE